MYLKREYVPKDMQKRVKLACLNHHLGKVLEICLMRYRIKIGKWSFPNKSLVVVQSKVCSIEAWQIVKSVALKFVLGVVEVCWLMCIEDVIWINEDMFYFFPCHPACKSKNPIIGCDC